MATDMNLIQLLARETVRQLGDMKGKKRDEMTVAFWCGAWAGLSNAGQKQNAAWVLQVLGLEVASRGFAECEKILNDWEAEQTPDLPLDEKKT